MSTDNGTRAGRRPDLTNRQRIERLETMIAEVARRFEARYRLGEIVELEVKKALR